MIEEFPKLPYAYDALEPAIDARTMLVHHDKHHFSYFTKLKDALKKHDLETEDVVSLLKDLDVLPEEIRDSVRYNGGGHVNHSFFWPLMKKNVAFEGEIAEEIQKQMGELNKFKGKFKETALSVKGSGWVWLIYNDGKLDFAVTDKHDNPVMEGNIPLLCLDMWEHAYYLKYQNEKERYIDAFLEIINWEKVNEHFLHNKHNK